ncbi:MULTISPECIES: sterol desaturase family protein [unclassified Minwuia]|jgi:sterol desaturase/sphingolipid hydroxylase (fatty acid hydroxylase superfamily)|uniref:sterol desaturase family protein n=1 Tax=unclassified Minwuia TaxID=2618799 RepID=UPI002479D382|nr:MULTISPECIES: sterol desaturase family protein [unclassified Minwuia]
MARRSGSAYLCAMDQFLLDNEATLRLGVFGGMLLAMIAAERLAPRRRLTQGLVGRWFRNLSVVVLNTLVLRLSFFFLPTLAVGFAFLMAERGIGLFNLVDLPPVLEIVAAVLLLDLAIWAQHVAFHKVPLFWRLHRVHHADMDIDVTTGLRFHPVEIILSMVFKFAVIALLGPAAVAVLLFEVVLNGAAMFNHANLRLPGWLDRLMRRIIVTPDFHRVHHSVIPSETDSNYGFNLTLWDRLFGTLTPQPRAGHDGMEIGLADYREGRRQGLGWMLALPFRRS